MILVQAAGVTDGGAGLWAACDGTVHDSWVFWGVVCCHVACRAWKPAAAMPFTFIAAKLR